MQVVNCFQIVSLRYWWHHSGAYYRLTKGCELLSDCIFEVLVTPIRFLHPHNVALWIAFRLYLWGIGDTKMYRVAVRASVVNCFQIVSLRYWWHHHSDIHTLNYVVNCFQIVSLRYWWHHRTKSSSLMNVVNCFQIVSLRYWWHPRMQKQIQPISCELLSDCIFEVLVTPYQHYIR